MSPSSTCAKHTCYWFSVHHGLTQTLQCKKTSAYLTSIFPNHWTARTALNLNILPKEKGFHWRQRSWVPSNNIPCQAEPEYQRLFTPDALQLVLSPYRRKEVLRLARISIQNKHRDQKQRESSRKEIQESKTCFYGETRDSWPKGWTEMRSRDGAEATEAETKGAQPLTPSEKVSQDME